MRPPELWRDDRARDQYLTFISCNAVTSSLPLVTPRHHPPYCPHLTLPMIVVCVFPRPSHHPPHPHTQGDWHCHFLTVARHTPKPSPPPPHPGSRAA